MLALNYIVHKGIILKSDDKPSSEDVRQRVTYLLSIIDSDYQIAKLRRSGNHFLRACDNLKELVSLLFELKAEKPKGLLTSNNEESDTTIEEMVNKADSLLKDIVTHINSAGISGKTTFYDMAIRDSQEVIKIFEFLHNLYKELPDESLKKEVTNLIEDNHIFRKTVGNRLTEIDTRFQKLEIGFQKLIEDLSKAFTQQKPEQETQPQQQEPQAEGQ